MNEERSTDRLARYIIWAASAAAVLFLCWFFRSVLVYIVLASVVSLLGRPIMAVLRRLKIKGKGAPDWLLSIISLLLIMVVFLGVVTQVVPVVSGIISSVSSNLQNG